MIQTMYGDLLDAKGVIVHGCNAQGVMGSGIAKQIKDKWPQHYEDYKISLKEMREQCIDPLGRVVWTPVAFDTMIVGAITQEYYGRDKGVVYVDYDAVRRCFETINFHFKPSVYVTINFPLIGCGLANGDWEIVSKIIDEELDDKFNKVLWLKEEG